MSIKEKERYDVSQMGKMMGNNPMMGMMSMINHNWRNQHLQYHIQLE